MSSKNLTCDICGSKKDSLFACLDAKSCESLNEHKTTQNYKKNQSVFIEGSSPRGVFCLNSGKVKIYVLGNEGKEQIIHIANEGEIIGFRALLSNEPYQLSATCIEDCQICY
ncbi:MAG: Crp/Fnr family transcriptional regulator, partial [Fluviicola sp.]